MLLITNAWLLSAHQLTCFSLGCSCRAINGDISVLQQLEGTINITSAEWKSRHYDLVVAYIYLVTYWMPWRLKLYRYVCIYIGVYVYKYVQSYGNFFYASFIICDEHQMFDYNVKKHAAVSLVWYINRVNRTYCGKMSVQPKQWINQAYSRYPGLVFKVFAISSFWRAK